MPTAEVLRRLGEAIDLAIQAPSAEATRVAAKTASEAAIVAGSVGQMDLARRLLLIEGRLQAAAKSSIGRAVGFLLEAQGAWRALPTVPV